MPFKSSPQKFSASIKQVDIGTGDKKIVLGGESVLPFYSFDGPVENLKKVGIEILDTGLETLSPELKEFYGNDADIAAIAKKAAGVEGADFLCLRFEGADPNGLNKSVEECAETAKKVADAVDLPLVVYGSKNGEKDTALFGAIADALQGKNVLFMSAKEENYKTLAASVGLAYGQKLGAESAVDINLAKQLNVLINQVGVSPESIVMNVGAATVGYGFEYVASTMQRIVMAALQQNDTMIQMPIITPVSTETWYVKESVMPEADQPEWGPAEERGVMNEIATAAACLAAGSHAVILRHPTSVKTISNFIKALA
ncbi:MAG: acetyl-CoA decarbonylase/synthase complex subunit delta [Eubacteriaceae bacterium]|jgi:acetyl-CoA decarbonylase/synthase complex subunit delta|nr:acetyl-CoA decarbonylase/synthase complex subunit delta [Eubacteriaceae bacterium]